MKRISEERTIFVRVLVLDDGTKIDFDKVYQFIEDSHEFEDTIGKEGNYTDSYIYFERQDEKELEQLLLREDVIRLSPNHNQECRIDNHKKYWLSDNYINFRNQIYKLL